MSGHQRSPAGITDRECHPDGFRLGEMRAFGTQRDTSIPSSDGSQDRDDTVTYMWPISFITPISLAVRSLPAAQVSCLFGFYVALRPRRRDDLLGTGTEWEGDRVIGSTAETARKRPERP